MLKRAGSICAIIFFTLCSAAYAADKAEAIDFIRLMTMSTEFKTISSRMALQKSSDEDIKEFAQKILDNHTDATANISTAITESDVEPLLVVQNLGDEHIKVLEEIYSMDEKNFNLYYLDILTEVQEDITDIYNQYIKIGEHESLKKFSSDSLPKAQEVLKHIKTLAAEKHEKNQEISEKNKFQQK